MARDETIKLSLIDGVTRTLSQIQQGVSGVGASLTKLNQGAELAAKGFGAVASAASAIGGAVQGAADLESALAALQAVTGASAAEFATLREAAISASERTRFTAIEAAEGLTELARAGLSATEAINVLNPALAIAQGNNISVAQSSELLTTTIKQFGASMGEAARFADVLQATADGTATSVEQIGNAMSYVAPLARLAGTSIEETSAIIGALADQGFRGERAGTALRNVFSALADPASKFSEALSDAGIQSRDFSTVIEALGKKGDAAKKILLALDSEARPAILSLVNGGGGAIADLTRKLEESAGAAERTSAILGDTFNGAVARLQNSVTNLRNEFLSPILQPLADEAVALAEKINALGDSPQFARIRDQFQELATNAIKAVGDLIENADLEAWAGDVADFAADAKTAFDGLVVVVKGTAGAIREIGAAIDFVRDAQKKLHDLLGENSRPVDAFIARQKALQEQYAKMAASFDSAADKARRFAEAVGIVGKESTSAGNAVAGAGDAAAGAAEDLRRVPEAAKLTIGTLDDTGTSAEQAAARIGVLQLQIAKLAQAQAALAQSGSSSGAEFQRLTAEIQRLEEELQRLKGGTDNNKGSQQQLGEQADRTSQSVQRFAQSLRDSSDAAEDSASSNSQVADSFGNIGQQAAAASVDLGNMSQALIDSALAMQAQARSGREIIKVWEGVTRRYNEANARIQQDIDLTEQRIAATSEEARVRRQLEAQYGTDSTLLEKLVQLRLQENREREKSIELADREATATERANAARAGQIGGFGQPTATPEAPSATGGRRAREGTAGGEGARGPAQIVINVQGMTTDQARQFVEQSVVPELERINRLSR